jgi:hypothetical protein
MGLFIHRHWSVQQISVDREMLFQVNKVSDSSGNLISFV